MFRKLAIAALCCGAMAIAAPAQMSMDHGTPQGTDAASKSFDGNLGMLEKSIVSLAEAMPADKFEFTPTQAIFKDSQKTEYATVSSFGDMVRHMAQANYYFFGTKGNKPPVDTKAIAGLKTKDESVAALKKSFEFAHSQIAAMTAATAFDATELEDQPSTRAAKYAFGMAHMNDHYGQLVEYLRMNGIIPPASRK